MLSAVSGVQLVSERQVSPVAVSVGLVALWVVVFVYARRGWPRRKRIASARVEALRAAIDKAARRRRQRSGRVLRMRKELASLLRQQRRWEEAEAEYRVLLDMLTRRFGADRGPTLTVQASLGVVLTQQGKAAEAVRLQEAAIDTAMRTWGVDHPYTVASRRALVAALSAAGQWSAAEEQQRTLIETLTRLRIETLPRLRSDPLDILDAQVRMAYLLMSHGRLAEAQAEYTLVVDACRGTLGPDHIITRRARLGLGYTEFLRASYTESAAVMTALVEDCLLTDDADEAVWCGARIALAEVRAAQGDRAAAVAELRALAQEFSQRWGTEHEIAVQCRETLGGHLVPNDPEEAADILTDVVQCRSRLLGAAAADTLGARKELAVALLELGRLDEAEREFQAALGPNKPPDRYHTLACRFGQARVMASRGDLEEADAHHQELLATLVDVFGEDHPRTLDSRFELATLLSRRGETAAAITAHRAVLDARIRVLGPDHPDTTRSRTALANEEGTSKG